MKRYVSLPDYADEALGDVDTIEEARTLRDEIARSFIGRKVTIVDNDNHEDEGIYDGIDDYEYPYNHINRSNL